MREAELDTGSEKSADSFFDVDDFGEHGALGSAKNSRILGLEKEKIPSDEHNFFTRFLKQVFIFLPGTLLLFFMSFGAAVISLEIIVFRRAIQTLPDDFPFHVALIGLIILVGTLMTWFGLGDLKNRKHLVIPASLMVTGAMIGAVVKIAASFSGLADRMLDDSTYLIHLLPLALIIPVLAKGIVDRKTEDTFK